jgi:hypothetical protein
VAGATKASSASENSRTVMTEPSLARDGGCVDGAGDGDGSGGGDARCCGSGCRVALTAARDGGVTLCCGGESARVVGVVVGGLTAAGRGLGPTPLLRARLYVAHARSMSPVPVPSCGPSRSASSSRRSDSI